MAVSVSKSGGIYIEINGNLTPFEDALKDARRLGLMSANEIGNAFKAGLSRIDVTRVSSDLTKSFAVAGNAAKGLKADLSSFEGHFKNMGRAAGIAEKDLNGFAQAQTKALQKKNADAFVSSLQKIQRQTGATDAEMNKLAKSLGGVGNEFTKASEGVKVFGVNLGTALAAGAAAYLGKKALDFGKESFDLAARYETLGVVVRQVGQIAGQSAVEVDKNVSSLRQMGIAGNEARKTLAQLIQAQVGIGKAPGLARIAQDAAVFDGGSSSEAFEKMVHGIQSAQTEVLRTIGINVNFEQSYAKMAASLRKTTSELTEQEKIQARVNAVTEAGERIAGSYEAAMTTLGKQMGSVQRIQQDFSTDIGKILLEVAKASGAIKGYIATLDLLSKATLVLRGAKQGVSLDEMLNVHSTQGLRDIVEGAETAREEIAALEAQMQVFAGKGLDVSALVEPLEKAKQDLFGTKEEISRLESMIAQFGSEGLDTTAMTAQLEKLQEKLVTGSYAAEIMRRAIGSLNVIFRAQATQAGADAPAAFFTFKPYVPGSGKDADVREIAKTEAEIRAAYGKTPEAAKQAKIATINEQMELTAALVKIGKIQQAEADKMNKAFSKELKTLGKGDSTASLAADRTAYQASEAAQAAQDSLKNLQLRYSELVAQIDGNSLGAALARSQRDLETQLTAIAKKEADIVKNRDLWGKEGKMSGEVSASLDAQQKALDQEKEYAQRIKEANDQLAQRADLARTYRANMDYSGLIGDAKAYYAEEVKLLKLQMETASESEKLALMEKVRIATAKQTSEVNEMALAYARMQLQLGEGDFTDGLNNSLAEITDGYKNMALGLSESFGGFFSSFTQGFSDSIGRAVVESQNLEEALYNVANSAISSLISSLVQLGIQWVVNAALGQSLAAASAATTTAMGVAQGAALATAYAPAAAAASLATSGGNSFGAISGITATYALTDALSMIGGFATGGYTGDAPVDQIVGAVHGKEFVFDAPAVSRIGVDALESLRSGTGFGKELQSGHDYFTPAASSAPSVKIAVSIENHGSAKDFEVEQISESEIRIIARDEARNVVRKETPGVVAGNIANPNSEISKSLNRNTRTERRR